MLVFCLFCSCVWFLSGFMCLICWIRFVCVLCLCVFLMFGLCGFVFVLFLFHYMCFCLFMCLRIAVDKVCVCFLCVVVCWFVCVCSRFVCYGVVLGCCCCFFYIIVFSPFCLCGMSVRVSSMLGFVGLCLFCFCPTTCILFVCVCVRPLFLRLLLMI